MTTEKTQTTDPDLFSSLEVLSRLTDTKIEAREICDKWLLITYDMPCTDEGNRARRDFLAESKLLGATQHTESVYLMPWTSSAEAICLELARKGDVCVWSSQTLDASKAAEITQNYDAHLEPNLDEISSRIDRIEGHLDMENHGRAQQMMEKTEKWIDAMEQTIIRRGSAILYIRLLVLKQRFDLLKAVA